MLIDTSSSPSRSSPDLTSERFITAGADEDDDGEGEDLAAPASEDDEASSSFYDIDTPTPSPAPVVMKCSSEEPHTTTPTIHIDDLSAVERLLLLLCQENVPFGEISIVLAYRTGVYMSPNALRSRCAVLLVRLGWITAEGVDSEDTMPSDHVDDDGTNDASPPEGKGRTQHLQDEGDGNVYGIGPEDSGNDADVESNGDFLEMDID
ncbi:hypothetical protein VTN31DRAFT_7115 [Thermomyces dupontii]|uniref:uncharacterized protein n=1 Tax=Talaromyces thermophilus TaxID=28565 RepID=UPI0037436759